MEIESYIDQAEQRIRQTKGLFSAEVHQIDEARRVNTARELEEKLRSVALPVFEEAVRRLKGRGYNASVNLVSRKDLRDVDVTAGPMVELTLTNSLVEEGSESCSLVYRSNAETGQIHATYNIASQISEEPAVRYQIFNGAAVKQQVERLVQRAFARRGTIP